MPKTICVDFDGVIHSYTSGWQGLTNIPDPPVRGAFEWLCALVDDGFDVCIYSSRSKGNAPEPIPISMMGVDAEEALPLDPTGVDAMKDWFVEYGLPEDVFKRLRFPLTKPAAMMTVDDRAFCFEGTYPSIEWLNAFKPWNKRSAHEIAVRSGEALNRTVKAELDKRVDNLVVLAVKTFIASHYWRPGTKTVQMTSLTTEDLVTLRNWVDSRGG